MELPRHDNRQVGGTGQPSTDEYRYRRVLDQRVLSSEKTLETKADKATTLAGYGITDAEQKGLAPLINPTSSYVVSADDKGVTIYLSLASPGTLGIPDGLPVGMWFNWVQSGAGQFEIFASIRHAYNNAYKSAGFGASGTCHHSGGNNWWISGNTVP